MIWYEIIRDLGDGSCAVYRFKTEDDARKLWDFWNDNDELSDWTIHKVDSEDENFFDDVEELLSEYDC